MNVTELNNNKRTISVSVNSTGKNLSSRAGDVKIKLDNGDELGMIKSISFDATVGEFPTVKLESYISKLDILSLQNNSEIKVIEDRKQTASIVLENLLLEICCDYLNRDLDDLSKKELEKYITPLFKFLKETFGKDYSKKLIKYLEDFCDCVIDLNKEENYDKPISSMSKKLNLRQLVKILAIEKKTQSNLDKIIFSIQRAIKTPLLTPGVTKKQFEEFKE